MYILRLDDASEYMDIEKWDRIEKLLDKYSIKPIVGIIPNNKDKILVNKYKIDPRFWDKSKRWQEKEWTLALHGYTHVYSTKDGGINPVNCRSEFAGLPLKEQEKKISSGIKIFQEHGLYTSVFFAPSHTFDLNTLEALRVRSDIRIISDTVANDVYRKGEFYFIPQQSGRVRKLPFKLTTFCYHPNNMDEHDFEMLEYFFKKHKDKFTCFQDIELIDKSAGVYDKFLNYMYFLFKKIRRTLV